MLYAEASALLQLKRAMQMPPWTLGDVIRKVRQSKGWTQESLAKRAGVNTISVVRLERESERADRKTIERVAIALDASVAELYAITEDIDLLSRMSATEHRHLVDFARRLVSKRQSAEDRQPGSSPARDLPAQADEAHEPIRKRQRR